MTELGGIRGPMKGVDMEVGSEMLSEVRSWGTCRWWQRSWEKGDRDANLQKAMVSAVLDARVFIMNDLQTSVVDPRRSA
jgi:hypothetical protein